MCDSSIMQLTWDSISYRHKRGVKSGHYTPNCMVTNNAAKAEGGRHVCESGVGAKNKTIN